MRNEFTNRRGLFVYGGESSADFGMVVAEPPAFDRPSRKQTVYKVPGKNGAAIIQQDAWEDISRTYSVWLTDSKEKSLVAFIDGAMAWLNSGSGYQRLEDSFEPDTFRLAYFSGSADIENKLLQAGVANIRFTCRPERFYKTGEQPLDISGADPVFNPTRYKAKPLLHIEGSGEVKLTISGQQITASITDYINIDCETMNAYREPTENKNADISGVFPTLNPGVNSISITGTVTAATLTPRFFTI